MDNLKQSKAKSLPPEQTVQKIKDILQEKNIHISNTSSWNNMDMLYSEQVKLTGLSYGTMGKGVTRSLALASAYGELAERFQNQLLYPFAEFPEESESTFGFRIDPSEKKYQSPLPALPSEFEKGSLFSKFKTVKGLWEETCTHITSDSQSVVYLPFYGLKEDAVVYLPRNYLLNIYCSNGMASGNSLTEAAVQAMGEIFERFSLRKIFFDNRTPPDIPTEYLALNAPEQFELLETLASKFNYQYVVKDCSMDCKLPVLGVVLFSPDKTGYRISLAAAPIWQIALERCITEMFQGVCVEDATFRLLDAKRPKQDDFYNYWLAVTKTGRGDYPQSFFNKQPDDQFHEFQETVFSSQRDMLTVLCESIGEMGYNIYCRNVSFLGFDTCQIIVPGMSELRVSFPGDHSDVFTNFPVISYLVNMATLSREQLLTLGRDIQAYLSEKIDEQSIAFADYLGLPVRSFLPWQQLSCYLFLALIAISNREYTAALENYNKHMQWMAEPTPGEDASLAEEYKAVLRYLELLQKRKDNLQSIPDLLQQQFGKAKVEKLIEACNPGSSILDKILFLIPDFVPVQCWDCENCSISWHCDFNILQKNHYILKQAFKESPQDQLQLSKMFEPHRRFFL